MHAISPSSHPVIYHAIQITATLARTVYSVAIKCFAACKFLFTQGKQLFNSVVDSVRLDLSERIGRAHRSQEIRRRQPMGHRADPSNHKLQIPLQMQNLEQSLWQIVPTLMQEDQKLGAERLKDKERVAQMHKEDSRANPGAQIVSWLNRIRLMADYDTKKHIIDEQINGFLLQAEKDPVFRESFLLTIDQAATTCGDRMAVSMLYVGLNAKKTQFLQEPNPSKKQMQEFAEFIIRGPWAVQKLQEYAQQVVNAIEAEMRSQDAKSDGKFKESIEVFLGLPIKLKKRLRLQFDVDTMLYEGYAQSYGGLNEDAVNTAGCMIEQEIEANKALILCEDPDWQTMLQKYAPDRYKQIIQQREELADTESNPLDWKEIKSIFIDALSNLTEEILSGMEY